MSKSFSSRTILTRSRRLRPGSHWLLSKVWVKSPIKGSRSASRTSIAQTDDGASLSLRFPFAGDGPRRLRARAARRQWWIQRGYEPGLEVARSGLRDLRGSTAVARARLVVHGAPPRRLPRDLRVELDRLLPRHGSPGTPGRGLQGGRPQGHVWSEISRLLACWGLASLRAPARDDRLRRSRRRRDAFPAGPGLGPLDDDRGDPGLGGRARSRCGAPSLPRPPAPDQRHLVPGRGGRAARSTPTGRLDPDGHLARPLVRNPLLSARRRYPLEHRRRAALHADHWTCKHGSLAA